MRKIGLILIIVMITITGFTQTFKDSKIYIDFGPKIMVGPSWMDNGNNSFYDTTSKDYLHKFNSYGFGIGGKFSLNFSENIGIVSEYIFHTNTQTFGVDDNVMSIRSNGTEIPLLLRINKNNDTYVEAGFVLMNTRSTTETLNGVITDYSNLYSKSKKGILFGVGGYMWGIGNWGISTGLRFRYNTNDMVGDNTKTPTNEVYALDMRSGVSKNVSVMIVLEFNYDLGFTMANSPCGRNRKFMLSRR